MAWFRPRPLELKFGEPVHLLVARACHHDAVITKGEFLPRVAYHFVGPHGIEYRGEIGGLERTPERIARLCEKIQQDFNERMAAMNKAREYAREKLAVPPLFSSIDEEAA
jgi:hypothetical protein